MNIGTTPDTTSPIFANGKVLSPHHREQFYASGIDDTTIKASGVYSEARIDTLKQLSGFKRFPKGIGCIVFPYFDTNGQVVQLRLRPDQPVKIGNSEAKYLSPKDSEVRAYFPPGVTEYLQDPRQELIIVEGEKKALKLAQDGFPAIGIAGVWMWKETKAERLISDLAGVAWRGRRVFIAFDSDITTKPEVLEAETRLAAQLKLVGAPTSCVRIPPGPPGEDGELTKQGADDFLASQGKGPWRALLNEAIEPQEVDPQSIKVNAKLFDPATEADKFLRCSLLDEVFRLRYWKGSFYWWSDGRYVELQKDEVRGRLVVHLNQHFHHLTTGITGNALEQLKAQSLLSYGHQPPCWIGGKPEEWKPDEIIIAKNGIIHLPTLAPGTTPRPSTPRLFTTVAFDYEFDPNAPPPAEWLHFLGLQWGDDPDAIEALQEWFGYCLTVNTRLQKILLLVGPKRSGKGTIARIFAAVIGKENVAGPTLASFATNFGLWPLWGKSAAIVSDARLSGKSDQAAIVERLLSISGEDTLTIDRKHQEPVTGKLLTRLMLISNELPRLFDSSGALAGRFIILRMLKSFYGKEDQHLTDKLMAERPGILLWAIDGWRRLRARGYFKQPVSGDALREQLEDIASPVGAFLKERCEVGPGCRTSVQSLYVAWTGWCLSKGRKPESDAIFGRDLAAILPEVRTVRQREGEARYRSYEGIRLLDVNSGNLGNDPEF